MSGSANPLGSISPSQASKEVTANGLFNAVSPAALFGMNPATTAALTWGYFGGAFNVVGTNTILANGTVALTASTTNYVEASDAGAVTKNTTGFSVGAIPLYTVVTGVSTVTSYIDWRNPGGAFSGVSVPHTIVAPGTTGAQTINKTKGRVNVAAAGTSLVVTCDKCVANSMVICNVASNDTTAKSANAVPAAGSFTIYLSAAATAETPVDFLVVNGV